MTGIPAAHLNEIALTAGLQQYWFPPKDNNNLHKPHKDTLHQDCALKERMSIGEDSGASMAEGLSPISRLS